MVGPSRHILHVLLLVVVAYKTLPGARPFTLGAPLRAAGAAAKGGRPWREESTQRRARESDSSSSSSKRRSHRRCRRLCSALDSSVGNHDCSRSSSRSGRGKGGGFRGRGGGEWSRGNVLRRRGLAAGADVDTGEDGGVGRHSDPSVLLFNTATRTKGPLNGADLSSAGVDGKSKGERRPLKFYSCGPTVYDSAHIGNFRAFLTYDILKRWLTYKGYEVHHVCNLTDVDDKIIARVQRDGISLKDLTNRFADIFFQDLKALNIVPATIYPRATDHIPEIVEMVSGLMDKGLAYEQDGSVYFRVSSFPTYGDFANIKFEDGADEEEGSSSSSSSSSSSRSSSGGSEEAGERGETGRQKEVAQVSDADEYEAPSGGANGKENAKDFALWKAYKEEDGDVFWETSLGKGRPGWHIECSAMARRYLGDTIDIHAGGVDLVFPHHENEIAQSEGFTGKPFCGCWIHNGFVNVDSEKMSKSKGNFLTLQGALRTALDVRGFRYLVVSSHYRSPLNFTPEALKASKNAVKRLDKFKAMLAKAASAVPPSSPAEPLSAKHQKGLEALPKALSSALSQFEAGLGDDLTTPRAAAGLFSLVKAGEGASKGGYLRPETARDMLHILGEMDRVFGLFYDVESPAFGKEGEEGGGMAVDVDSAPAELQALLKQRATARAAKDWGAADAARDAITALGYAVKDVKAGGVTITKL